MSLLSYGFFLKVCISLVDLYL